MDDEVNWREDALCRQFDPALFFPRKDETAAEAREVCRRCPVRDDCLDYAVRHRVTHGIWGGKTELQRRRLWRLRDAA